MASARSSGSPEDESAGAVRDREELVDAGAPAVAGAAALVAAAPAPELGAGGALDAERLEVGGVRRVGRAAGLADAPQEALGEDALQDGGDEVGLDAHILKSGDRARRVVGVERREDEVAGERRLDRDLGGLEVADLADEDHAPVLPHDVAEPGVGREPR